MDHDVFRYLFGVWSLTQDPPSVREVIMLVPLN